MPRVQSVFFDLKTWPRAPIMAWGENTCLSTSTSSCSDSIDDARRWRRSRRCSASPVSTHPLPTRCCMMVSQPDRQKRTYALPTPKLLPFDFVFADRQRNPAIHHGKTHLRMAFANTLLQSGIWSKEIVHLSHLRHDAPGLNGDAFFSEISEDSQSLSMVWAIEYGAYRGIEDAGSAVLKEMSRSCVGLPYACSQKADWYIDNDDRDLRSRCNLGQGIDPFEVGGRAIFNGYDPPTCMNQHRQA